MSSAGVYTQNQFSEPISAQHNFANQFDLSSPEQAMQSYSRIMHQHTQGQYEVAASSARRRSSNAMDGLQLKPQTNGTSVSSTDS
ncbi:hypothetical protein LTR50_001687 [Elasticomyces elasticus]|nr:hypothetical protein LTR50_001687 [Elasticomyces elasticus]